MAIAAGDLSVRVITLGAVIRDMRLAGVEHPLVLGFDRLDDYLEHSPHFGAVVGRSANRIGRGRFSIDGHPYQLSLNENGRNHLHGGFQRLRRAPLAAGRSRRHQRDARHRQPGRRGRLSRRGRRPGCATASRRRRRSRMEIEAATDAPTLVNLAQHSYFNLDDSPDHPRSPGAHLRRRLHADRRRRHSDRRDRRRRRLGLRFPRACARSARCAAANG